MQKLDLNIYRNRKVSTLFGFIDFSYAYFLIRLLAGLFKTIKINRSLNVTWLPQVFAVLQIVLILSIFVSTVLYFSNKIETYYMYFGQIILRFVFAMPSLGLLLKINYFVKNVTFQRILLIFCLALDFVRLVFTIIIIKKSKSEVKEKTKSQE